MLAYGRCIRSVQQGVFEVLVRQTQFSRNGDEKRTAELFLIVVNRLVHLPEAVMLCREFRRLRRTLGIRVNLGQREMPEDESQLIAETLTQFIDDRMCGAAGRTLVVTIFDKRRGRVVLARAMIIRRDWHSEYRHRLSLSQPLFLHRGGSAVAETAQGAPAHRECRRRPD